MHVHGMYTVWLTGAIAAEQRKASSYSTNGSSNGKQSYGHNNGPRLSPAVYEMVLEQLLAKHVRHNIHVYNTLTDA
jgi:hypothetical protein